MAREIRRTITLIQSSPITEKSKLEEWVSDRVGSVAISEAIRRVLGGAIEPLKPSDIWAAIQRTRIPLRTTSSEPRRLIDATLSSMKKNRQVRRVHGGWELVS
jgi:hypothetical protein